MMPLAVPLAEARSRLKLGSEARHRSPLSAPAAPPQRSWLRLLRGPATSGRGGATPPAAVSPASPLPAGSAARDRRRAAMVGRGRGAGEQASGRAVIHHGQGAPHMYPSALFCGQLAVRSG
eukprot:gene14523-biopygen7871